MLELAAGALDPAAEAELRAHLASGCPACAAALAEAEALVGHLPLALDAVAPSLEVRERLMQRIAGRGEAPATLPFRDRNASPRAAMAPRAARWPIWGMAAAVLLAVSFFIIGGAFHRRARDLEAQIEPLQNELAAVQHDLAQRSTELETVRAQLAAVQRDMQNNTEKVAVLQKQLGDTQQVMNLVGDPQVQIVVLKGQAQPDAGGRILWDKRANTWHLVASNLKDPGAGKTYELWFIPEGKDPVRAGEFNPGDKGLAILTVKIPEGIGTIAKAGVTQEPTGGSDKPTMPLQLLGSP